MQLIRDFLDWMGSEDAGLGQGIVRAAILAVAILALVPLLIWLERRLLSWMQDRVGPNRVATFTLKSGKKFRIFGLLQPIADGVKLFLKEDITPKAVDSFVYFVAPGLALFPAFALGGTMPWGPVDGWWSHLQPVADVNIGILYLLAVSSLGVYGIVLAGYTSNNKYSLLGGLRSSAQLISYELAMGMALAAVVLASGSLKMTDMVRAQQEPWLGSVPAVQNWFILTPYGFIAGVIFFICMLAETNRVPFDLPEAENELIAGYHTEYSSMKFAVFFMGEYAAMFIFSGVFAAVFLGGSNMLPVNWLAIGDSGIWKFLHTVNYNFGPIFFIGKMATGIAIYIWIRATLPRLRYDQLMNLGWKVLLPIGVGNFMLAALWVLITEQYSKGAGWIAWIVAFVVCYVLFTVIKSTYRKDLEDRYVTRKIKMVEPSATGAQIAADAGGGN